MTAKQKFVRRTSGVSLAPLTPDAALAGLLWVKRADVKMPERAEAKKKLKKAMVDHHTEKPKRPPRENMSEGFHVIEEAMTVPIPEPIPEPPVPLPPEPIPPTPPPPQPEPVPEPS